MSYTRVIQATYITSNGAEMPGGEFNTTDEVFVALEQLLVLNSDSECPVVDYRLTEIIEPCE